MSKVRFTSASAKENGKAATTTVDALFEALNGKVDPQKLSKICVALSQQGAEAIFDIEGYSVLFTANRATQRTLRTNAFPAALKAPRTGDRGAVTYKVNGVRLVKTALGV